MGGREAIKQFSSAKPRRKVIPPLPVLLGTKEQRQQQPPLPQIGIGGGGRYTPENLSVHATAPDFSTLAIGGGLADPTSHSAPFSTLRGVRA